MSNNPLDSPDFDPDAKAQDGKEAAPAPSISGVDRMRQAAESRQVDADDDPEEDLWKGGYSPKAMFGNWALAAVVTVGMLVVILMTSWRSNGTMWMIWLGVTVLLWGGFGAYYLYRRWSVKYELSTQRFIHQEGLLKRVTDRIEVIDIDDVTFEQGLIERMVGVGKIRITSSDRSHPELVLLGIENVKDVAETIDDVRRKERRRRGLHIEAI